MRAVLQRVMEASVGIEGVSKGAIGRGMLVFLGIGENDGEEDVSWLSLKLPHLRIFPDEKGLMNRSLLDCGGDILLISQFTLFGNLRKGNRPSFNHAALPPYAIPLYERFTKTLEAELGRPIMTGEFGAAMQIHALNDGPVTLFIDTKNRKY